MLSPVAAVAEYSEPGPSYRAFACSECGRQWTDDDDKWPIRVTDTDPPRAVAACPDCADRIVGYEARYCGTARRGDHATFAPAARR
jgi:hypothetical protein